MNVRDLRRLIAEDRREPDPDEHRDRLLTAFLQTAWPSKISQDN